MPEALRVQLSKEDIETIQGAVPFDPLFPMNFLFNYRKDQMYNLSLTAANNQQYQMAAWIKAPVKQSVCIFGGVGPLGVKMKPADTRTALSTLYSNGNNSKVVAAAEI